MAERHRRRATDHYWHSRENWYRDVWLLAITVVIGLTLWSAKSTSDRAQRLARQIQAQRVETLAGQCESENLRNHATISTLNHVLNRAAQHARPSRRRELHESRRATVLLINALAPYQNCRLVVKLATTTPHRH